MTKYNSPRDNNLVDIIASLRSRIDRLERFTKPTTLSTISPMFPAVTIDTSIFTDVAIFAGVVTAQTPVARILATCSDGATVGEFRLTDMAGNILTDRSGLTVPSSFIPAGTTTELPFENNQVPNYWLEQLAGSDLLIKLQVRRTAGAGTINVRVKYLVQIPS